MLKKVMLSLAVAALFHQHAAAATKTVVLQQGVNGYTRCMTAELRVPGEESRDPTAAGMCSR